MSADVGSWLQFLDLPELDVLSRALSLSTPTLRVSTRVEAYSCKQVSRERKLVKLLESELMNDISHSTSVSPPEHHRGLLDSAFGPLDDPKSRKTLWLLIGLLNVAFPDHDFSRVRPEEFRREESGKAVLGSLSSALDHLRAPASQRSFSAYPPSSSPAFLNPSNFSSVASSANIDAAATNPFLRQVLDPIINLAECEVYSYTPDMDSDPHAAESDDESDVEGESDAFEKDDPGMAWEMDGVDSAAATNLASFYPSQKGPGGVGSFNWLAQNRPSTPMKSFASFLPTAPGTPQSIADSTNEDYFREASSGGLLWSSNYFLYNKSRKRILFISIWAKKPDGESTRRRKALPSRNIKRVDGAGLGSSSSDEEGEGNASTSMKRLNSASSIASLTVPTQRHGPKRAKA